MDGTLGNERALLQNGQECDYGPYYRRSSSLRSLNAISSSTLTSILVRRVRIKQGTLCYCWNDENKCTDISKDSIITSMPLFLRSATLNVMEKKDIRLRMNFTQPYIDFLPKEGIRVNFPILRSLNFYDRSDGMDQMSACSF